MEACADIIAAHFPQMEELVLPLDLDLIARVLASSKLCIKSEEYLLDLVRRLIDTRVRSSVGASSLSCGPLGRCRRCFVALVRASWLVLAE